MKILHVCQRYWPGVGGSERYIQEISERLVRGGHNVTVYTTDALDMAAFWDPAKPRVEPRSVVNNGVKVQRFPIRYLAGGPLGFGGIRRLMATVAGVPWIARPLLRRLAPYAPWVPELVIALRADAVEYDVIHATNVGSDALLVPTLRAARRAKTPVILTPLLHLGESARSVVRAYYTMPHQLELVRQADAIISLTEIERDYLQRVGVEPERITVTGAGINPSELAGGDGCRFRLQRSLDRPFVLYLGASAYDKGTTHLVEAMRRLWDDRSSGEAGTADLVLAGTVTDEFRAYAKSLPASARERIHQLGTIDEVEKRDALDAAVLLAMPSRTDSFGLVYLEAWLYGKPVVGARAGGIPALVEDGSDGYLVAFGDVPLLSGRIAELLTSVERRRQFGERGRAKVLRKYTWDRVYPAIEEVYERSCRTTRKDQRAKSKR